MYLLEMKTFSRRKQTICHNYMSVIFLRNGIFKQNFFLIDVHVYNSIASEITT